MVWWRNQIEQLKNDGMVDESNGIVKEWWCGGLIKLMMVWWMKQMEHLLL